MKEELRVEMSKVFVTGPPGSGKSTVVSKAVDYAVSIGVRVYGFYTPEVRRGGSRVGFDILATSGERVELARKNYRFHGGFKLKTYSINPGAGQFIKRVIEKGLEDPSIDLLVIDEIGPMELFFREAREAFVKALESSKPVIGVIHRNLPRIDPQLYSLASRYTVIDVRREGLDKTLEALKQFINKVAGKT